MKNIIQNHLLSISAILVLAILGVFLIVVVLLSILGIGTYNIKSVSPQVNSINNLFLEISVTFSRPLSDSEKKLVILSINPEVDGASVWSVDSTKIVYKNNVALAPNTKYTVLVNYRNQSYSWSFSTVLESAVSEQDQMLIQGKNDNLLKNAMQDFYAKNPWYYQIPISTNDYFVGFNTPKNSFFVYLYLPKGYAQAQYNALKTKVLTALANIGVKSNSFNIEWNVSSR